MNHFFIVFPKTVDDAMALLEPVLTRPEKNRIANMDESRLIDLIPIFGPYILTEFRLPGNDLLLRSCINLSEKQNLGIKDPVLIILWALRKKLQSSHDVLRVVK
jgi:hypothetical protein